MKSHYLLYAGKPPVEREEVQRIIEAYNAGIRHNHFQRYMHILAMIPSGIGRVLDYGCGWGCLSRAIAEKNNQVVGIDPFEGALEIARDFNAHPSVEYLNQKITDFEPDSFDLVNSNQVLEHVHNPGLYLSHANSVLKIGGMLVISVPNVINLHFLAAQLRPDHSSHFRRISQEIISNYSKDSVHIQSWEPHTFINLLASTGYEYIQHRFLEGTIIPFGKSRHSRFPWGGRYWHTRVPSLKNLSYTMLFQFKKVRYVEIQPED